jgi:phosphatidylinositol alpha-1,6-mannosyltransferase
LIRFHLRLHYPSVKILFYTNNFPPVLGGTETYSEEIARRLAAAGHDVTVAVERKAGWEACDARQPFRVERLAARTVPAPLYRMYLRMALGKVMHRDAPDVVFLPRWFRHSATAAHLCAARGVPYCAACHGGEMGFDPSRLTRSRRRRIRGFQDAARVLANSEHTRGLLERLGIPPGKIVTVYPGVDPAAFARDDGRVEALRARLGLAGRRVLLTVARLVRLKGVDTVLRALPRVKDASLVIVGYGECEPDLRRLAAALGVGDRVHFAGAVPRESIADYYHLCDVFVLTSRAVPGSRKLESFGIAFVEAAICGKPVVGGNVGGVAEAVADRESGLLVDSEDPEAVADRVVALLADPARSRAMGEAGRARAEKLFTWEGTARAVEAVFRECCRER